LPCGIASHNRKFEIDSASFYLKENETRAFVNPSFKAPGLDPSIVQDLLGRKHTLKELGAFFEALLAPSQRVDPEPVKIGLEVPVGSDLTPALTIQPSFELESPKFATGNAGIFTTVPQLSYDVDSENEDEALEEMPDGVPPQVIETLKDFQQRFVSLKTKWTQTFLEVDSSHSYLLKDIQQLHRHFLGLKQRFSKLEDTLILQTNQSSSQIDRLMIKLDKDQAQTDVISADVAAVNQTLKNLQVSLEGHREEWDFQLHGLESSVTDITTKFESMDRSIKEFEKRFTIIFPILKNIRSPPSQQDYSQQISKCQEQIYELSTKLQTLDQQAWQQFTNVASPVSVTQTANTSSTSIMEAELRDLKAQMKVLQHRIVGGGVKIGSKVFQSFEDVQVWVKAELPIRRYGLFVDAVSILDFFSCLGHIDAENQVSTLHNANKAGFTSIYESRVATSVQNIFPRLFGKGESHQYLPAIRQPDKWDDGTEGLSYQITRGMTDVETQLNSAIDTILENYPEARSIASQCLFKAKRFVVDLCSFMSKDYFKWITGGHTKQDAWNMTSLCVRRVFEEIHSERVVARDIYDPNDLEFTTAKMLWATWKAHGVMETYLKHHFYEHPSISAVLARHLADNYVKHDSSQLSSLEKDLKSLTTRVDKLTTPKDKQPGKQQQPKGGPKDNDKARTGST
jgi:hypothetical protein